VDLVWGRRDEVTEEVGRSPSGDLLVQFNEGKLGYAVDRHEQVELALGGSNLGDVDMEFAYMVCFYFRV
jgi:hypothetical protein